MRLINIIFGLLLLIIGTFLGDAYRNSLYLYWLLALSILVLLGDFLINSLQSANSELELYKNKVTTLSILKGNGGNPVQISILPKNSLRKNREEQIEIYATFSIPLNESPDIKLITDDEWKIKINNQQVNNRKYAGKYEYILSNSLISNVQSSFVKFSFFVNFDTIGDHKFSVEITAGNITGNIENVFKVNN